MRGKLLVISGLSGAGKGTIAKALVDKYNDFVLSISATTRDMRPGEVDSINYFFKTNEEFEKMIENDELIEYARYVDNYYGTPKKFVLDNLEAGINVILEIEMQGALKIKKIYDDAILVFFLPKSAKILRDRLISRGRDNLEQIEKRLEQVLTDSEYAKYYDYVVINDNLDDSVQYVRDIVESKYDTNIKNENLKILSDLCKDVKEKNYV